MTQPKNPYGGAKVPILGQPERPAEAPMFAYDSALDILLVPHPAEKGDVVTQHVPIPVSSFRQAGWSADPIGLARLPRVDPHTHQMLTRMVGA